MAEGTLGPFKTVDNNLLGAFYVSVPYMKVL
jgi:hypothetical protein